MRSLTVRSAVIESRTRNRTDWHSHKTAPARVDVQGLYVVFIEGGPARLASYLAGRRGLQRLEALRDFFLLAVRHRGERFGAEGDDGDFPLCSVNAREAGNLLIYRMLRHSFGLDVAKITHHTYLSDA